MPGAFMLIHILVFEGKHLIQPIFYVLGECEKDDYAIIQLTSLVQYFISCVCVKLHYIGSSCYLATNTWVKK